MYRRLLVSTFVLALAACQGNGDTRDESAATAGDATPTAASGFESDSTKSEGTDAPTAASGFEADSVRDAALAQAIAGAHRSEANRHRDQYRHPQQTLEFFGIKPSMSVLEITPGGGWYSEILSPWLRDHGQFIGAIWDDSAADSPGYFKALNKQLRDKFAGSPELYGKARLIAIDAKAPDFSAAGAVDAVLTFRNVHNWTQAGNDAAWFKAFFAALKPGGVLGVVDHRAKPGTTLEATLESGYLTEDYVIGLATGAGFVLEEKSEINANPTDTKDYEAGVWTLPPTLGLKDKDREKYLAIGESDRMTLRFRKPGGDAIHSSDD
jgi:predicted methyltransferase